MTIMDGLSDSQKQAVSHRNGPAIIVAGPGAGKTSVLTKRAASLLEEGVQPERILLLTFTRAAANTMIGKAKALDQRAQFITAGTFHSWCIKILNANSQIFGRNEPFTILDQDDASELIKRAMTPLKGDVNWPRASTVAKIISYATNTNKTIAETLRIKAPDHIELAHLIEQVRDVFIEEKLNKGMIDYDDVLSFMVMLLEDEEIGAEIRSMYDYIMVDEYQDTNEIQLKMVHGLVGENGNVTIVGDPSQAIYSFRGGSPATMDRFKKAFPDSKVINLDINYRSTPEIVKLVNAIDKKMDIGFERTLIANKPAGGPLPQIINVTDGANEAQEIANAILLDKANDGEIKDHAILVRSTASARRIETELMSRKIPHKVMGGIRIDEAAHIKDLLSIARITTNLSHEPAWLRMVSRFRKIGNKAAEAITARVINCLTVDEACNILREEGIARKTDLVMLADAIEAVNEAQYIAEGLDKAISIMNPIWSNIWDEDWKLREKDLEAIVLISEEHPNLTSFLTTITLDGSMDREVQGQSEKEDEEPVTISTIHSAKGLEWKHVHVPAFVQGGMPSLYANGPDDMDEELRVFYVAASRAEKTLTFYKPRLNNQNNMTGDSLFESIARPHIGYKNQTSKIQSSSGKINSEKRIDLKSRMIGQFK